MPLHPERDDWCEYNEVACASSHPKTRMCGSDGHEAIPAVAVGTLHVGDMAYCEDCRTAAGSGFINAVWTNDECTGGPASCGAR